MSTETPPTPKGMRLWVRILLVVSLALNLLVIGAVAGIAIKGGPWKHGGPPGPMAEALIGPLTRALNKEDRRAILRQIRKQGRAEGASPRSHKEALQRMVVMLETAPFDQESFAMDFTSIVEDLQGRMSSATQIYIQHLSDMSDEQRAAYATRVKEAFERKSR